MSMRLGLGLGLSDGKPTQTIEPTAPTNLVPPLVSGSDEVGSELTVSDGSWSGQPPPTYTYQWRSDTTDIIGATANAYTTVEGDVGAAIDCVVTATNSEGSASEASSNSITVTAAATAPVQFGTGDWSVADAGTSGDITITITTLPDDGGSAITDLQYQIDGGAWTSLGGTTTGSYGVSGLTDDVQVSVAVRAVNAVGAGTASATKTVTPTAGGGGVEVTDDDWAAWAVAA